LNDSKDRITSRRPKHLKPLTLEENIVSTSITETKPFKLSSKSKKMIKDTRIKIPKFVINFRNLYLKNQTKLMKVIRPVPVKLILKNIATWYNDKTQNSKDSKIIRNQTMAEYLYDLTYNKYGIPSLTDKKLKEI